MAIRRSGGEAITVVMPPEPPELNPKAAGTLLRILLKAYEKKYGHPYTPGAEPEPRTDAQDPGPAPDGRDGAPQENSRRMASVSPRTMTRPL